MLKSEMNDKWRQWKHDLKRAFDPSKTEEENASTLLDDRVDSGQYRALVHHWFSEEGQVSCFTYICILYNNIHICDISSL